MQIMVHWWEEKKLRITQGKKISRERIPKDRLGFM
jgi:hypothetical protein